MKILVPVLLLVVTGCTTEAPSEAPSVVVTTPAVAAIVEALVPEGIEVVDLSAGSTDAHDLEMSPSQIETLQSAEVVIVIGGGFQPAIESAAPTDALVLSRLIGQEDREGHADDADQPGGDPDEHDAGHDDEHAGEFDPHFWLSPASTLKVLPAIAEAVSAVADPLLDEVGQMLNDLDAQYRSTLAGCAHSTLVTSHAAFGYVTGDYGLEGFPLAGSGHETEPMPQTLAKAIELVRDQRIPTVFAESRSVTDPVVAVARDATAEVAVLDPLEGGGTDYFDRLGENLEVLAKGLDCQPG